MSDRIIITASDRNEQLTSGWELAVTRSDAYDTAGQLTNATLVWIAAEVPGTVASTLATRDLMSLDDAAHTTANNATRHLDSDDYWYRLKFSTAVANETAAITLNFAGLATIADVWLNGQALLQTDNMFRTYSVRVEHLLRPQNELLLRFKALDTELAKKRPRPKWRTPMITHQQLRYLRTTLLGRTPGWSPSVPAIGPWRAIALIYHGDVTITDLRLHTTLTADDGIVAMQCALDSTSNKTIATAQLVIRDRDTHSSVDCHIDGIELAARLTLPNPKRWWPHTHGEQPRYTAQLQIKFTDHSEHLADLGCIGFRTVALDTSHGNFAISINDEKIFCRGACWTPIDTLKLDGTRDQYRKAIAQARDAGFNMLRVGGTMTYENDFFYEECDRQGMLVWQEFMFANMDYPGDDPAFLSNVRAEASEQLLRFNGRPSLTVICGNSEVEQQAAMWGATRDRWQPTLFHRELPALVLEYLPGVPYWPSSAHGGAFPHQGNVGTTSYYGVGAYLRDPGDARRAEIRFASECLAFANVPENSCIEKMPKGLALKVHHPEWKARTPRDLGAGWDFEDVRDFYLRKLFNVDPMQLRYAQHDRYLDLSRVVSGEVMAMTYVEWRRQRSTCNGALIWFWRDLVHGAGWGVIDADGNPKAAYYFLRRVLQSQMIAITDEGGNGAMIHIANDSPAALVAEIQLCCYRHGETQTMTAQRTVTIDAHRTIELAMVELLDGFSDITYAYRFGAPSCDLVVATLNWNEGKNQTRAFYLPLGLNRTLESEIGLTATARWETDDEISLTIATRRFAQYVSVDVEGFTPNDAYFNIAPGGTHTVSLRGHTTKKILRASVKALNSAAVTTLEIQPNFTSPAVATHA